jgi:tetratricopeptide (TPR) repeat protein
VASLQSLEIEQARLQERHEENPSGRLFAPLADVLRKLGRVEEALEICREGLSRHPAYSSAYVILGKVHLELDMPDAAVEAFEKVLELDSENLLALRHLAKIHEATDELDRAEELWSRVATLEPDSEAVEDRLAALRRRRVKNAEPEELDPVDQDAEAVAAAVEEVAPDVESGVASSAEIATITLAQIYYEQGFLRKAFEVYEQVQARNPKLMGIDEQLAQLRAEIERAQTTPTPAEVCLNDLEVQADAAPRPPATALDEDGVLHEGPITRAVDGQSERERFDGFRRWLDGISDDSEPGSE